MLRFLCDISLLSNEKSKFSVGPKIDGRGMG